MNPRILYRHFSRIGARLQFRTAGSESGQVRLNVVSDQHGEAFEVECPRRHPPELLVLDVQPADRHLLLMSKTVGGEKGRWLLGFDDRHWFVAAVPESAPVGTVRQAKEALKPPEVQARQVGLNARGRSRRKNSAFLRQGEWFFVPCGLEEPPAFLVVKDQPITRGVRGSKPHWCEYLYRRGGETAWVCFKHPGGVGQRKYDRILRAEPSAKRWRWSTVRRNARTFAKGLVRHPDHKALVLRTWHEVWQNTEPQARASAHVKMMD